MKMGMKWAIPVLASILILGSLGLSQQSFAEFAEIIPADAPPCDKLVAPVFVDEIGNGALNGTFPIPFPFPPFEELTSGLVSPTSPPACTTGTTDAGTPNPVIFIKNEVVPPTKFPLVWYVSDADTTVSNLDGFEGGSIPMFLIDSVDSFGGAGCGANCPLIFESMTLDGIWEPGETWHIILQDFTSPGALPQNLNSIGVGFPSTASDLPSESSGSIVVEPFGGFFDPVGGTVLPIDSTALLVAGAYTTASWMIPILVAGIGIGLAVFTLKRNR